MSIKTTKTKSERFLNVTNGKKILKIKVLLLKNKNGTS